jgi:hypothetical protein
MKLRLMFIITALTLYLAVPAFAEDAVYQINQYYSTGEYNLNVEKAVVSNKATTFSMINYPPERYNYLRVHYWIDNPTNNSIKVQLKLTVQDDSGAIFTASSFLLADPIPANQRVYRVKEFAVPKNSTYYTVIWSYFDKISFEDKAVRVYTIVPGAVMTPTPTPVVTPTPTPSPVSTPTPTPSTNGLNCLPMLPLGVMLGCVGGMVLVSRGYKKR